MEKKPDEIRQEIYETREQLEETVEALAYKADISARAKDAVHDKVDAVKGAVGDALGIARTNAQNAGDIAQQRLADSSEGTKMAFDQARGAIGSAKQNAKQNMQLFASTAQSNPLGLAIGSIAIGFLIGSVLPATQIESEQIGGLSDQITESAKSKAGELFEQGKSAATQAMSQAFQGAGSVSDPKNHKDDSRMSAKDTSVADSATSNPYVQL